MIRTDVRRLGIVLAVVTTVLAVGASPAAAVQGDGSGEPPPASVTADVAFGQGAGTGAPSAALAATGVAFSQAEGSGEPTAALADGVSLAKQGGTGLQSELP